MYYNASIIHFIALQSINRGLVFKAGSSTTNKYAMAQRSSTLGTGAHTNT